MREVRFRLWNPEEECFTCPQNIEDDIFANPVVHPSGTGQFLLDSHCDLFILEEYTGLKDKNGVEIYEGDICGGMWDDDLDYRKQKFRVEFDRGAFVESYFGRSIGHLGKRSKIEVIGNIHENPELLTNNQK